ncbi:MAG: tRNA (adenosine(37)-N6)-threonylcarbamoyltransferase complex ATPase subunit type 1 TsaE [bacterium]|nr:tRNA (adenosine(37)-N6)-threonylcarbamoyltransferase complex ATPase subunit type 1 TsaE [bacterium]
MKKSIHSTYSGLILNNIEGSIQTHSAPETKRVAKELGTAILESPKRKGAVVFALKGELGAGKTSFVQGLAKGLGVKENVLSPTFLIVKSYKLRAKNYKLLYHIDCYRLKTSKELLQLEWKEIVGDPNNIVAVEWADRVKPIIPKDALWISFSYGEEDTRAIRFR